MGYHTTPSGIMQPRGAITASRRELMDALLRERLIGLKLKGTKEGEFEQNYAIFKSHDSQFSPRVFLHGRDFFSERDAQIYFSAGFDKSRASPELFDERARAKIKALLSHESFSTRHYAQDSPDPTTEENVAAYIEKIKSIYPEVDFSSLAQHSANSDEQIAGIKRTLAKAGLYSPPEVDSRMARPVQIQTRDSDNMKLVARICLDRICQNEHGTRAQALRPALMQFLEERQYDLQVLENFKVGLEVTSKNTKSIQRIHDAGLEARVTEALRKAALTLSNPYEERFRSAEGKAAAVIARAVQPRVLRHSIKRKTPFLITDNDLVHHNGKPVFPEILEDSTHLRHIGIYKPKLPMDDPYMSDFIAIAAPELESVRLGAIARHELEHALDGTHPSEFHEFHPLEAREAFARDRQRIEDALAVMEKKPEARSKEEQASVDRWQTMLQTNEEDTCKVLQKLFAKSKIISPELGEEHPAYMIENHQVKEVPAIVEEMKGLFGKAIIREMMPETLDLVRRHRYHHPGLRNNSDSVLSR